MDISASHRLSQTSMEEHCVVFSVNDIDLGHKKCGICYNETKILYLIFIYRMKCFYILFYHCIVKRYSLGITPE